MNLDNLIKYINEVVPKDRLNSVHGITHWNRVAKNGKTLAAFVKDADFDVIQCFAYLHDHKRINDDYDTEHGPRAAEAIDSIRDTILAELSDEQFNTLKRAIKIHTVTDKTGNPTIDCCLDADKLDLPRVGIVIDVHRMATVAGKIIAAHINNHKN